jgi:hypothetical protein
VQPVLFDSSIYITALRTGDGAALALRRLAAISGLAQFGSARRIVCWSSARQ